MRTKFTFTAVVASVALAISAPAAFAQTAVQNGYSQPGGVIQSQVSNGNPSTPEAITNSEPSAKTQTSSQLPFTGLDVGLVLAAGAMLLAAGLGIRRVSRRTSAV